MSRVREWLDIAADRTIVRRSAITGAVVSVVLTAVDHGGDLVAGRLDASIALWMGLAFIIPFVASTIAGVAAVRDRRAAGIASNLLLEREIEAVNKFPDQNPNPVLRVDRAGLLLYANPASAPIRAALGVEVGGRIGPDRWAELEAAAEASPPGTIELVHGPRTFELLAVPVPELDVLNLYGTDITAAKVVERFPAGNPNPVLRMTPQGELIYANRASAPITRALGMRLGDRFPAALFDRLGGAAGVDAAGRVGTPAGPIEVHGDGRTYELTPVLIEEFGFVNIYGTDVTARKAVDKFPDQNPNPVLRVSRDGRLQYANPASALVRRALGLDVGDELPEELYGRIRDMAASDAHETLEVVSGDRVYELLVVKVFEFDVINLYGTDVTAAREVERLLLNILPVSIAQRLRRGEMVIADRFEEMSVLFADVADFTPLSARMAPGDLVALLNQVFSVFDRLADRFGLEKIKTIGDAYMVVGGLTPDLRDHAERVAEMGMEMIAGVERLRTPSGEGLRIRVGIHVGPAIAGVIGIRKFIYDVWGDTVNTASRMESHGVAGRIQVTEETYERLRDSFDFEPRGPVDVKGKGRIPVWLLVGHRGPSEARTVAGATRAGP